MSSQHLRYVIIIYIFNNIDGPVRFENNGHGIEAVRLVGDHDNVAASE